VITSFNDGHPDEEDVFIDTKEGVVFSLCVIEVAIVLRDVKEYEFG